MESKLHLKSRSELAIENTGVQGTTLGIVQYRSALGGRTGRDVAKHLSSHY